MNSHCFGNFLLKKPYSPLPRNEKEGTVDPVSVVALNLHPPYAVGKSQATFEHNLVGQGRLIPNVSENIEQKNRRCHQGAICGGPGGNPWVCRPWGKRGQQPVSGPLLAALLRSELRHHHHGRRGRSAGDEAQDGQEGKDPEPRLEKEMEDDFALGKLSPDTFGRTRTPDNFPEGYNFGRTRAP